MRGYISILLAVSCILTAKVGNAAGVDNSIYAGLLEQYVKKGRVDYDGFKDKEGLLDQYLEILSSADPKSLTRNHRLAFYINAYNAFTIKLILTKYPNINSIKELGGFLSSPWGKKFFTIGGWKVSLDYIEHEVLRPEFKDPRVHFAINCASRSCPPLLNRPYEGQVIDQQLEEQTRAFINNKRNTFTKGSTVFISKIFDWFTDDFNDNPLLFIRQYAGRRLTSQLDAAGQQPRITFLYYDWSLNKK